MNPYVVSDVGTWSAFFDEFLRLHRKLRNSALGEDKKAQNYAMSLINTATTTTKSGGKFPYFHAVDTGRSSIDLNTISRSTGDGRGQYLVYAGVDGVTFRHRVGGYQGADITTKALAKINTTIDVELQKRFQDWLDEAHADSIRRDYPNKKILLGRAKVGQVVKKKPKAGAKVSDKEADAFQNDLSIVGESNQFEGGLDAAKLFFLSQGLDEFGNVPVIVKKEDLDPSERRLQRVRDARAGYDKIVQELISKSNRTFEDRELIRKAMVKANAASAAEANRIAQLRSLALSRAAVRFRVPSIRADVAQLLQDSNFNSNEPGFKKAVAKLLRQNALEEQVNNNLGLRRLAQKPNWYAAAAIFIRVVGDQIETAWKPNTPVRQGGKIIYVSAGHLEPVGPDTAGDLVNGYKLIASASLAKVIAGLE